jgi:predicted dinucleotide-binding enzyme
MDIEGKNALVLGGCGLVGMAVCRELLAQQPAVLVIASRRRSKATQAAEQLQAEFLAVPTRILPAWGDVFWRAAWQCEDIPTRAAILADSEKRQRLVADILNPLDEDIIQSSLLTQIIQGKAPGLEGLAAQIVVDCMNTATRVAYQDIYAVAVHLQSLAAANSRETDWPEEIERLLACLYVPQLVRHVQILYEAMRRAGTLAYIKVGTSGTGGMGLNLPYTHGEEKPSRLLLAKSAIAGAQTLMTFLLARTPGGPTIVKEVKPTALLGWKAIEYGPIRRSERDYQLYDCPPEQAVSIGEPGSLTAQGEFGTPTGQVLEGVYIHLGENGRYTADEFAAISAPGQMQFLTAEEVAKNVVAEINGGDTGRDVINALDGATMGPSFRGGYLRQAALNRLRQLEAEQGEAVAFEFLGPPRISKLLFEAYLLKRVYSKMGAALEVKPNVMAAALEQEVCHNASLRQRIISIGIPILLADGQRLLRGPSSKSADAYHGWVDLRPANMAKWQERLIAIRQRVRTELSGDTSSRYDRVYRTSREWLPEDDAFEVGEIVAWILSYEEHGERGKN